MSTEPSDAPKIDLDDLERKATAAAARRPAAPWRVYRCHGADAEEACGIKDRPFVSTDEDTYQIGVVVDTNRDECQHAMCRAEADHIAASNPTAVLALIARIRELEAVDQALALWLAVEQEIDDAADEPGGLVPMSPRTIDLGGRSIEAWKRVEAAHAAVRR